jgi:hypothetical protein
MVRRYVLLCYKYSIRELIEQAHVFQIAGTITQRERERGREKNLEEYTGKEIRAAHTSR